MNRYTNLDIIGVIPAENEAETVQFNRVLEILNQNFLKLGPWNKVLIDYKYLHHKGEIIENDKEWYGQIDLIVFSQFRILIYELKGFTVKIIGATTNQYPWLVKKKNWKNLVRMDSPFKQVSRQRTHLLNNIFVEGVRSQKNHWVIDSRVIFKNGSDFYGFWFFPPKTITKESFQNEYLLKINNETDRLKLKDFYSDLEESTDKLQLRRIDFKDECPILRRIFDNYALPIRTRKWFNVLTENQIISDLDNTGSQDFELFPHEAEDIIAMMLD